MYMSFCRVFYCLFCYVKQDFLYFGMLIIYRLAVYSFANNKSGEKNVKSSHEPSGPSDWHLPTVSTVWSD